MDTWFNSPIYWVVVGLLLVVIIVLFIMKGRQQN